MDQHIFMNIMPKNFTWQKIRRDQGMKQFTIPSNTSHNNLCGGWSVHYRPTSLKRSPKSNVRGEPAFSVMAAGWFNEKFGWIGKVEVVKPMLLKIKRILTGNQFEEEDFYPYGLWNRRIIRFDSSRVGYHMVIGFRSYVRCRLVAVWWMANTLSLCFILAFHYFATLKNRLTYQCPSSWPVVITMKKKLAGTWKKNYV